MSNRRRVARAGGGLACWLAPGAFAQQPSQSPFSPTNIFAPVSGQAHSIVGLSIFVLSVTAAIFVVVFSLLVYSVVKFRKRGGDDSPRTCTDLWQQPGGTRVDRDSRSDRGRAFHGDSTSDRGCTKRSPTEKRG